MLQAVTGAGLVNAEVRAGFGRGWPCTDHSVSDLYERWQHVGYAGHSRRASRANVTWFSQLIREIEDSGSGFLTPVPLGELCPKDREKAQKKPIQGDVIQPLAWQGKGS